MLFFFVVFFTLTDMVLGIKVAIFHWEWAIIRPPEKGRKCPVEQFQKAKQKKYVCFGLHEILNYGQAFSLRVLNCKIIFLFCNQNIRCGYSMRRLF